MLVTCDVTFKGVKHGAVVGPTTLSNQEFTVDNDFLIKEKVRHDQGLEYFTEFAIASKVITNPSPVVEVQKIVFAAVPNEGYLKLSFEGWLIGPIAAGNVTASNVQAAFRAATPYKEITVTGDMTVGLTFTLTGYVGNAPMIAADITTNLGDLAVAKVQNLVFAQTGSYYDVDLSSADAKFFSLYNGKNERINVVMFCEDGMSSMLSPTPSGAGAGLDVVCSILVADTAAQIAAKAKTLLDVLLFTETEGFVATVLSTTVTVTNRSGGVATDAADPVMDSGVSFSTTTEGADAELVELTITQETKGVA